MKKLIALLLAIIMVFSLVACSSGDSGDDNDDNQGGGDATTGTPVVFEFGENGEAKHVDGNDIAEGTTFESGAYTLTLNSITKSYSGAFDATGNSCIKLGTSKAAGGFTFTVGADVKSVVIKIAGYKAQTAKITVNGTAYTVSTTSNNGQYTQSTVDTTTNKTVSLTTVSGGLRAMIDSITYYVG